jgi:hypothetical protein
MAEQEQKRAEQHTPGPWSWGEGYDGLYGCGQDEVLHSSYEGGMWLAHTKCREANARLMAAAPTLLDALQALVAASEAWNASVEQIIGRPPNWSDGYLDAARAAIAKAIGSGA